MNQQQQQSLAGRVHSVIPLKCHRVDLILLEKQTKQITKCQRVTLRGRRATLLLRKLFVNILLSHKLKCIHQ